MKYDGYLKNVASRFESLFELIEARYNFDYGDEFELALCDALRAILPERFGICRGFVVSSSGDCAGDDLIIFDRIRFPTLRILRQDSFARKEQIPVEAVYAYIEAKHTLEIEGDSGQSLKKASTQVAKVKSLPREDISLTMVDPYVGPLPIEISAPKGFPKTRNPMYGAIISRRVRQREGSHVLTDHDAIHQELVGATVEEPLPDLIIAGKSNIVLPYVKEDHSLTYHSPFHVDDVTTPHGFIAEDMLAFGIGLCSLLHALDFIRLGVIPWKELLAEGLNQQLV